MGAGFSKAWDAFSPTENELFTFPKDFLTTLSANIELDELLAMPCYPSIDDTLPETFKELLYHLSMHHKYPGVRIRYMGERGIRFAIDEIKVIVQNASSVSPHSITHYDGLYNQFSAPVSHKKSTIATKFFAWLSSHQTQYKKSAWSIHCNFISTNDDYVVETIFDNIGECNTLRNTYRDITTTKILGVRNSNIV